MNQQNQDAGQAKATNRDRRRAPVAFNRLKAERVEEPLEASKVLEKMASLPGWGLSPKGISLARQFRFPGAEEARAFSDFLVTMSIGQKVRMKVTQQGDRVTVNLRGRRGGVPGYLLDFASMLAQ
jgi:pterin-4a-carbinolamine dehydratase